MSMSVLYVPTMGALHCSAAPRKEILMKYSLLMICGAGALLFAAPSASALDSCYQICTPSVSCGTPCIDPYRPYLGPIACGAGFPCNRGIAADPDPVSVSNSQDTLLSAYTPNQAACDYDQDAASAFLPPQPGR